MLPRHLRFTLDRPIPSINLCRMESKREQSNQQLNTTSKPKHTLQTTGTAQKPATDDSTHKQQYHSNSPTISLDVMQSKQLSITHQIAISTRKHINRQLIIAQKPRRGDLHSRLETERGEKADDENVVDDTAFVFVVGVAGAVVGDEVGADDGGGDDDEEGLDEEDCA